MQEKVNINCSKKLYYLIIFHNGLITKESMSYYYEQFFVSLTEIYVCLFYTWNISIKSCIVFTQITPEVHTKATIEDPEKRVTLTRFCCTTLNSTLISAFVLGHLTSPLHTHTHTQADTQDRYRKWDTNTGPVTSRSPFLCNDCPRT